MAFQAEAIANVFLAFERRMHPMKLQKLVYIAHGWNLAVTGDALVNELPEAWDNGPVFSSLYKSYRYGEQDIDWRIINPFSMEPYRANLNAPERRLVDAVWNKYKDNTASELSKMTHREGTPWTMTYFNYGRDAEIPNHLIRNHFRQIAKPSNSSEAVAS